MNGVRTTIHVYLKAICKKSYLPHISCSSQTTVSIACSYIASSPSGLHSGLHKTLYMIFRHCASKAIVQTKWITS